mmetsp:Transcript_3780/g.5773  ORF Transcript_3780/g.5773 Transcript_3780/m.5773 type:complete len:393 (-) Transcript_3780:119-1297(-)
MIYPGKKEETHDVNEEALSQGEARYTEEYCKCVMVTGGVGFVGSHMAEALLKDGRDVVVYDIFNSETTQSQEKIENADLLQRTAIEHGVSLSIINGNILNREKIAEVVRDHNITACIHVGGMVDDRRSVTHPDEYITTNIMGTAHLLDTLGQCGVKMVVQASTRSVFGQRVNNEELLTENSERRPINPYGASKVGADAMAHCYSHLHKMNVTLIRVFSAYGPRGRPDMIPRIMTENIYHGKPIKKFGDGTATRTWVYVDDIVSAFISALKNPRGGFAEYNTGAPNSMTLNEMIACAEKVSGKKAIIHNLPVPPGDANKAGKPSYDLIKKELGWEPKVSLEEGMKRVWDDYVARQDDSKLRDLVSTKDLSDGPSLKALSLRTSTIKLVLNASA